MTRRNQDYPPELREQAVRMVAEVTPNYDSQGQRPTRLARSWGGTAKTVGEWVRQAEVDAGQRPGYQRRVGGDQRLKREVAELREAPRSVRTPERSDGPSSVRSRQIAEASARYVALSRHADQLTWRVRSGSELSKSAVVPFVVRTHAHRRP